MFKAFTIDHLKALTLILLRYLFCILFSNGDVTQATVLRTWTLMVVDGTEGKIKIVVITSKVLNDSQWFI